MPPNTRRQTTSRRRSLRSGPGSPVKVSKARSGARSKASATSRKNVPVCKTCSGSGRNVHHHWTHCPARTQGGSFGASSAAPKLTKKAARAKETDTRQAALLDDVKKASALLEAGAETDEMSLDSESEGSDDSALVLVHRTTSISLGPAASSDVAGDVEMEDEEEEWAGITGYHDYATDGNDGEGEDNGEDDVAEDMSEDDGDAESDDANIADDESASEDAKAADDVSASEDEVSDDTQYADHADAESQDNADSDDASDDESSEDGTEVDGASDDESSRVAEAMSEDANTADDVSASEDHVSDDTQDTDYADTQSQENADSDGASDDESSEDGTEVDGASDDESSANVQADEDIDVGSSEDDSSANGDADEHADDDDDDADEDTDANATAAAGMDGVDLVDNEPIGEYFNQAAYIGIIDSDDDMDSETRLVKLHQQIADEPDKTRQKVALEMANPSPEQVSEQQALLAACKTGDSAAAKTAATADADTAAAAAKSAAAKSAALRELLSKTVDQRVALEKQEDNATTVIGNGWKGSSAAGENITYKRNYPGRWARVQAVHKTVKHDFKPMVNSVVQKGEYLADCLGASVMIVAMPKEGLGHAYTWHSDRVEVDAPTLPQAIRDVWFREMTGARQQQAAETAAAVEELRKAKKDAEDALIAANLANEQLQSKVVKMALRARRLRRR